MYCVYITEIKTSFFLVTVPDSTPQVEQTRLTSILCVNVVLKYGVTI